MSAQPFRYQSYRSCPFARRAPDSQTARAPTNKMHARSVTLSSERLRVIAKLDLVGAEVSWRLRSITNTARHAL
jgi:hypothetical protein